MATTLSEVFTLNISFIFALLQLNPSLVYVEMGLPQTKDNTSLSSISNTPNVSNSQELLLKASLKFF
ncbi:hypothetical protein [Phormidesmis priestleyi]